MDTATPPIPASPQEVTSSEREDVPMAEGSDRASVCLLNVMVISLNKL